MFLDLAFTCILLMLWRSMFHRVISSPLQKVVLIGGGAEVAELAADLHDHPQKGYRVERLLEDGRDGKNFADLVRRMDIEVVVAARGLKNWPDLEQGIFECIPLHLQFFDLVDFYEQNLQRIPLTAIDKTWFLRNLNEPAKQFFSGLKRMIDIVMAFLLGLIGVVLAPFILLALAIESGPPFLFSQMRVGQFERPFRIYKFRSLGREGDHESTTRVGAFLRFTHLDEIPQLWNILKGEMSFVGPRPEMVILVEAMKQRIPFYRERHLVRPGITGWAQLHEPRAKASDAEKKLQYDLFYVKNRSLLLDMEIILKTLRILLA